MNTAKILFVLIVFTFYLPAYAQLGPDYCGSLANPFGPYDYRSDHYKPAPGDPMPHNEKRKLVEDWHFTPRVESLIGAQSGGGHGPPGQDLDYTLRAFPNNHRALMSVMRYAETTGNQKPPGLPRVVECYFERAIRFQPDDAIARIIYSIYLTKNQRRPEALTQLETATAIAKENAFTHYNIGLAYFDMELYDRALESAHRALALGFEKTQLRNQLEKAGKWQEPSLAGVKN